MNESGLLLLRVESKAYIHVHKGGRKEEGKKKIRNKKKSE